MIRKRESSGKYYLASLIMNKVSEFIQLIIHELYL